jgi:hypothetical protein
MSESPGFRRVPAEAIRMRRAQRGRTLSGGAPRALLTLGTLGLLAAPGRARAADFLPAASLHLEAARYEPVKPDLHWTTTIGGGADLVGAGSFRGYIVGDVETLIGNTRRAFDASQANYTLEAGFRFRAGRFSLNPFFHHVSRHLIDRNKEPAVDWNILGLRADTTFAGGRLRTGIGAGHTTLASLVGYRWEVTGYVDADLVRFGANAVYGAARGRFVTVEPEPELVRGDFLDWTVEGGLRFPRGARRLDAYVACDHRNDVYLLVPGALTRAMFGARIVLVEGR